MRSDAAYPSEGSIESLESCYHVPELLGPPMVRGQNGYTHAASYVRNPHGRQPNDWMNESRAWQVAVLWMSVVDDPFIHNVPEVCSRRVRMGA